jgi:mandelate racemase
MLVDVETEEGVTGRAYLFCYVPAAAAGIAGLLADIERRVKGERLAPLELWKKLAKGYTLIGVQGIVRMAMAGFDVACWDALARALGVPLATLLGAAPRPVRAYNSNGLGLMQDLGKLAGEAEELLGSGFGGVKLRLGYPALAGDVAAVRAVRKRIGPDVALMVDYNQALGDDYLGAAQLARELATPVQIGENFSLVHAMEQALEAHACDLVMPDLERIGGVTGWMRAAGLAAARGIPMSSHLFPEVSAHLLAATPTAHWLEYVDWAAPVLEQPIEIVGGEAVIPDRPGNGMSWNAQAVERYRMA